MTYYRTEVIALISGVAEDLADLDWEWTQEFGWHLIDGPRIIEGSADLDDKANELPDEIRELAYSYRDEVRANLNSAARELREAARNAEAGEPLGLVVSAIEAAGAAEVKNGGNLFLTDYLVDEIRSMAARSAVDDEGGSRVVDELTLHQALALTLVGEAEDGDYTLQATR